MSHEGAGISQPSTQDLRAILDPVSPDYGSEHCVCGSHATPDPECPVHWAIAALERAGLYR